MQAARHLITAIGLLFPRKNQNVVWLDHRLKARAHENTATNAGRYQAFTLQLIQRLLHRQLADTEGCHQFSNGRQTFSSTHAARTLPKLVGNLTDNGFGHGSIL
jgi:hypothetical protein